MPTAPRSQLTKGQPLPFNPWIDVFNMLPVGGMAKAPKSAIDLMRAFNKAGYGTPEGLQALTKKARDKLLLEMSHHPMEGTPQQGLDAARGIPNPKFEEYKAVWQRIMEEMGRIKGQPHDG